MKNHFETEAFVMNVKEFQYSKGTGHNFSFAMRGEAQSEDKNSAPTVWISGVSFNQPILDKRNYLLKGKLQVKPPYKDYPAGLQLVVSEAILLEAGMYVVAKKKPKQDGSSQAQTEDQVTGAKPSSQTPQPTQSHPQSVSNQQGASQPKPNIQEPPQGGGEYIDSNGLRQTTEAQEYRDPVQAITMPEEEIPF